MTVPRLVASLNRGYIASRSRINSGSIRSCGFFVQTRNKTDRRGFASSTRRQTSADLSGLRDVLRISEEVADAVATNKPVVALESTIYTHGAFQEDLGLEQVVRELGAVPAVCGVYNGVATVGLEKHEIQEMVHGDAAKISRRDLAVIVGDGLRGVKRHGGTTIAGTMILARLAGIRVFGTGGLGGVHRGVQNSMDISADLTELGRTRVAVICSGCKGFLDIPRTLEYLETQGAVVSTFNTAGEPNANVTFPAFWARNSGVKSPSHLQGPEDAAYRIYAQEKLGLESGLLLANPIPAEAAIPSEVMEDAIKCAVKDAKREGFTGSDNTPFVLQRIKEYTEGRSVGANLALVRSNVAMAARVAQCLSNILQNGPSAISSHTLSSSDEKPISFSLQGHLSGGIRGSTNGSPVKAESLMPVEEKVKPKAESFMPVEEEVKPTAQSEQEQTSGQVPEEEVHDQRVDIVVAGSVALDLSCDYRTPEKETSKSPRMHTSNPATITQSVGGVGHNVALAAHRFGAGDVKVKLCSVIGDDVAGATVLEGMRKSGLSTSGIRTAKGEGPEHYRTAQYVAVNDSQKSLVLAMADMDIISSHGFSRDYFIETLKEAQPKCVVVDANLAADSIRSFLSLAADAKVVFEPVSVAKSVRLFDGPTRLDVYPKNQVDLATPNIYELWAMYDAAKERGYFHDAPDWFEVIDRFNISGRDVDYKRHFDRMMAWTSAEVRTAGVPQKVLHLLPYIPSIVVKFGGHGCLLAEIMAPDDPRLVRPSDPEQLPVYIKHQKFVLTQAAPGVSSGGVGGVYMRYYYPSEKVEDIVSVNGVGDTFLGVLAAGLARGVTTHRMIIHAQKAAVMTLRTAQAVSPHLDSLGREVRFKANSWNLSLRKEGRTPAFLAGIRRSDNSWDDVLEAEETSGNKTTVDGLDGADASADVTGEDGHKAAPVASAAGPWLEDEGPTAVQEDTASLLIPTERGPLFQNKSENDVLGSSTTGNDKQPTPLASEEIGSSSANQVGATVETEPKGREAVMDPQPPRQIPAAKLIHEALAKMGMSKEQAEHAIKAVAAEGPHVRRKADYVAKMATQKATAKAEAQKGAKLDNEAQNKQGWGTFARRVQEVVIKDELSVFNKQVVRAAKEHGRARGGSNEKRS